MNILELICKIEDVTASDGEKSRFLTSSLKIDRKPFHPEFAMDLNALADSCTYSGVFEILTCGCGVAGCAGIYEGIRVTHGDGIINWQIPRPFSWPPHKTLPKNITYTEFVFDKQQYVEAICNGVKEAKKLLRYAEEKHESVETGPCGFTTYDFFSLNISSSGFCSSRINKALEFSAKAHLSQVRKGTDIPYITHPFAVGMILANAWCSVDVIVAGILHDTVEDTDTTLEDIKAAFGEDVATIVAGCSEPDKDLSWEERKQHTIDELKHASLEIQHVACADKLHNIHTIIEEHTRIGDEVWKRFKRGKEQQKWYYHGLLDSLSWGHLGYTKLFREFKYAVEGIFGQLAPFYITKIISGGQTGADRAALDVALETDTPSWIAAGGWCPAGRRAEDGVIPEKYPLTETSAKNYAVRTRWNVRDSEGTLILNLGELDGGTLETLLIAQKTGKPCLVVQLDQPDHQHRQQVITWLREHAIHILNIAGPRESKRPGTYRQSYTFLKDLLKNHLKH